MISLGSVSRRTKEIYDRFYADRVPQRYENLYFVYDRLASYVDASHTGVKLELDYLCLAEIVRSYFLDTIRYKEYHFDPKAVEKIQSENVRAEVIAALARMGVESLDDLDPLSADWSELVHRSVNINSSKVAAYTVKWIIRYKPISVVRLNAAASNGESLPEIKKPQSFLTNINEQFALHSALLTLGIDATQVSQKKIDELIYCFRFRPFDESAYFMILSKDYLIGQGRD